MTGGDDQDRLAPASVDWEANAPRSIFFGDIYFSGDGAAEAAHVFIGGNNLAARFADARDFLIGELGFGTGLNILVTWDLWRRTKKRKGARLHFLSVEKFPLSRDDFARAHAAWPQFDRLSQILAAALPPAIEGAHRIILDEDVTLTLCLGDARAMLPAMEAEADAWFLDGFAPAKNPQMWTPEIFREVARLSKSGATAATFTVAGDVRRALQAAGFAVEKRPGFGRKREMLTARLDGPPTSVRRTPWFANDKLRRLSGGAHVAVIGGGVAAASLAFELSRRDIKTTLFAPHGIADGASGNPAGLIMPRLDLSDESDARFFRIAYAHTLGVIETLQQQTGETFFNACGVLLKSVSDEDRERHRRIKAAGLLPDGFIEPRAEGLFFPQAGVIEPAKFCRALATKADLLAEEALAITENGESVNVKSSSGARRAFDAVILANGRDALKFVAARSLPLSGVMGQVDYFPQAAAPAHAIAFGPYAAPAPLNNGFGGLVIGATYENIASGDTATTSVRATIENIAAVAREIPALHTLRREDAIARAAIRCQTPDRLPVAGPLPDWNFFSGAYDDLRQGKTREYPPGAAQPGLFILSGLGARGLVTAPFAASILIAEAAGEPFERELAEAIHPARFFIRDLKRSQRIVAR
jgi:tRNA 5-methylaminomethyl-2-thiouridine biosynthesis bifunctional protein